MPTSIRSLLESSLPPLEEMRRLRIWDGHSHLMGAAGDSPAQRVRSVLAIADRMGIERLVLSLGTAGNLVANPTPEEFRLRNDQVMEAMQEAPDRTVGLAYLNPNHLQASLDELKRCVRDGPFVGIKLWVAARVQEALHDPIAELAGQFNAPIFQHTWLKTGGPGTRPGDGNSPGESSPQELAELAARHPAGVFVCMHSGGDWEPGIRALRAAPNVLAEVAGSNPTAGFVETAVRELGQDRVTYGSDILGRSFSTQMAKVVGARVPFEAKFQIMGANLRRIFEPIMRAKGLR